jgi:hypothetical protein
MKGYYLSPKQERRSTEYAKVSDSLNPVVDGFFKARTGMKTSCRRRGSVHRVHLFSYQQTALTKQIG